MTLITEAQHAELLATGLAAREAGRAGLDFDPKRVVKLFIPHWYSRWLLTEIHPIHGDRAFGLCDLGHGRAELGYVSLRELEGMPDKLGCSVERDLHFVADKPISAYADAARTLGPIIT